MALSTISLKTASKISDLYVELCSRETEYKKYGFYKYSELQNFDIIDIQNAFKILTAHKIFNSNSSIETDDAKKYAELAGGLLYLFPLRFAPNDIAEKINLLDKNDRESVIEFIKLKNSIPQNHEWNNAETLSSFLKYLLSLDKTDENFWESVYERIGIFWDREDLGDEINFIINNKNIFFKRESLATKTEKIDILKNKKDQNLSIYKKHQYFFDQAITYVFLGLSIFFPVIRILVFSIIVIFSGLKIYFWIQEPIKQKFIFFLEIIEFFLFASAIFLSSLTLYAIGFTLFTSIIFYIKGTHKNYNSI
jgi:hypothetical protein